MMILKGRIKMNAVIFLDIDGVLAPKERIQTYTMIEQLNKKLAYKKEDARIEALPNNLVMQCPRTVWLRRAFPPALARLPYAWFSGRPPALLWRFASSGSRFPLH